MKKFIIILTFFSCLLCFQVSAATPETPSLNFDPSANNETSVVDNGSITKITLGTSTPLQVIIYLTNVTLTLLGIFFLLLIIYAGFLWMTASGNEQKIDKAKDILKRSIIGLAIILMSVGISYLIYWLLSTAPEYTSDPAVVEMNNPR